MLWSKARVLPAIWIGPESDNVPLGAILGVAATSQILDEPAHLEYEVVGRDRMKVDIAQDDPIPID